MQAGPNLQTPCCAKCAHCTAPYKSYYHYVSHCYQKHNCKERRMKIQKNLCLTRSLLIDQQSCFCDATRREIKKQSFYNHIKKQSFDIVLIMRMQTFIIHGVKANVCIMRLTGRRGRPMLLRLIAFDEATSIG